VRRRALLSALALVPATGCLGFGAPGSDRDSPSTKNSSYDPEDTFRTIHIGEQTGEIVPHVVGIWNAVVDTRAIHVTMLDRTAGATRHDQNYEVPGDTALALELRAPARYQLTIRVPNLKLERSIDVPRTLFDTCNDSFTHISVRKSEPITVQTLSTELACITQTA
jgi:hypothetical protein